MKNKIIYFILIIAFSSIIVSCNNSENAFLKAKEKNTIDVYEAFIKEYPNGIFADSAKLLIEKLTFLPGLWYGDYINLVVMH